MSETITAPVQAPSVSLRGDTADQTGLSKPGPGYKYARFLPHYDPNFKLPPLEPFEHIDPGHAALNDPNPRSFLDSAKVQNITPKFGSEVSGIQLSQLDSHGKSQLALYVAQRGVVIFRDQDFIDQPPEWQLNEWGKTFGRLHVHPTSGQPKEFPEYHLIYRDHDPNTSFLQYESDTLSLQQWHSDITYEQQPPGITTLFLYQSPESGGDTAYVNQVGK